MEVFPDFSSTTPEEKWKSGRWSPGRVGGEEEEKLFLRKKFDFNELEPVLVLFCFVASLCCSQKR